MGFARNFLVPMGLAEVPTSEKIEALAGARVIALEEYEANRTEQAGIIEKLEGIVLQSHVARTTKAVSMVQ